MDKTFMYNAWDLPDDIDMKRINDRDEYLFRLKEIRDWNLKSIVKGALLYDEKVGDKDKPRKWYLIGSYFYYKVLNHSEYADEEHLILGTFCFLRSIYCKNDGHKYYNTDLSTVAAARILSFWGLFNYDIFKDEFLQVRNEIFPNSESYPQNIKNEYVGVKLQIENCLTYQFFSIYNSIQNDYREYIDDSELDFMNWRVRPVKILFDYNYAARNEIIELQQKYLDIFWNKLQSDSFIKEINN